MHAVDAFFHRRVFTVDATIMMLNISKTLELRNVIGRRLNTQHVAKLVIHLD
jgi:hypothetical protein